MKKYRVKINGGRIVGPLDCQQLVELYRKGHINYQSEIHSFPGGEWHVLSEDIDLSLYISKFIADQSLANKENPSNDSTMLHYLVSGKVKTITNEDSHEDLSQKLQEFDYEDDFIDNQPVEQLRSNTATNADEINKIAPSVSAEISKAVKHEVANLNQALEVPDSDKTQFLDFKSELALIKQESLILEKEISKSENEKVLANKITKFSKPVIKKNYIYALFLIFLIIWLLPDEKPDQKSAKLAYPSLDFPQAKEFENEAKSVDSLQKGIKEFNSSNYLGLLKSSQYFKESFEYKSKGNVALDYIVLSYSLLFDSVKIEHKAQAAQNLFHLIQVSSSKRLNSEKVLLGSAIFFDLNNKSETAIKLVESYRRIKNPTVTLMSYYLKFLLKAGQLEKARLVVNKIETTSEWPEVYYLFKSEYLELDEKFSEIYPFLKAGLSKYPNSIGIKLKMLDALFLTGQYEQFKDELAKLKINLTNISPYNLSEYFEKMGYSFILDKNNQKALEFFKKSFEINESNELRSNLASLEVGGSNGEEKIIVESKIKKNMNDALKLMGQEKWDQAFLSAIKAVDLDEGYIPSSLLLTRIQIRRGYFESAIKTLENLKKRYPLNPEVNLLLVDAYVKAGRLENVKQLITSIGNNPKMTSTAEYSSLLGNYYLATNNINLSIQEYKKSIFRDPLNDKDYFELAQIFLKYRKYATAKNYLSKCIELDPSNIDYRISYGQIVYEIEGATTAIGYLRDLLDSYRDDPKLLSQIAIYYYQSGQVEEFRKQKEQLEKLPKRDALFYKFLMNSAMLEGDFSKLVTNATEYFNLNPGDIQTRMELVKYLFDNNNYPFCISLLNQINERLPSYPKVNYYLAKISIMKRDYKAAIKFGELEIKLNPNIYFGYYITGEAYRLLANYSKSIKYFEEAIRRNPYSTETLVGFGWIKRKQNYLDEAREYYMRAKKQDSGNADIYKQLGFIYKESGQSLLAIESFKVYLQLNPGSDDQSQVEQLINQLK